MIACRLILTGESDCCVIAVISTSSFCEGNAQKGHRRALIALFLIVKKFRLGLKHSERRTDGRAEKMGRGRNAHRRGRRAIFPHSASWTPLVAPPEWKDLSPGGVHCRPSAYPGGFDVVIQMKSKNLAEFKSGSSLT